MDGEASPEARAPEGAVLLLPWGSGEGGGRGGAATSVDLWSQTGEAWAGPRVGVASGHLPQPLGTGSPKVPRTGLGPRGWGWAGGHCSPTFVRFSGHGAARD